MLMLWDEWMWATAESRTGGLSHHDHQEATRIKETDEGHCTVSGSSNCMANPRVRERGGSSPNKWNIPRLEKD
eukprot:1140568-Pelagomonas_calceolata.AAC.5